MDLAKDTVLLHLKVTELQLYGIFFSFQYLFLHTLSLLCELTWPQQMMPDRFQEGDKDRGAVSTTVGHSIFPCLKSEKL